MRSNHLFFPRFSKNVSSSLRFVVVLMVFINNRLNLLNTICRSVIFDHCLVCTHKFGAYLKGSTQTHTHAHTQHLIHPSLASFVIARFQWKTSHLFHTSCWKVWIQFQNFHDPFLMGQINYATFFLSSTVCIIISCMYRYVRSVAFIFPCVSFSVFSLSICLCL